MSDENVSTYELKEKERFILPVVEFIFSSLFLCLLPKKGEGKF
jgi:hypothetical protein